MINVLADRHHSDLWWSLHLLVEKRLGGKLYVPVGMNWFDEGYYHLYGDLRKRDPFRWLAKEYLEDTIYGNKFEESKKGCTDYPLARPLTLDEFKDTPIDIIICSVNENEPYFAKLKEFKPDAKFIRQAGNELDTNINNELYPNLMSSAKSPYNSFDGNKILYRQEFDLNLFKYSPPKFFNNFYSFQNDMKQFEDTWDLWLNLKHNLDDFNFKSYGVANDDGKIFPKREYIKKMQETSFVYQSKGPWEGYGHVIHNSICMGRPMVIRESDYAKRIAEPLLIDKETCLFIDDDLIEKIRRASQPDELKRMSEKCRDKFNEIVNFDNEFETIIKPFFNNLI